MLKKKIGIIDCDFGNIASLVNAIKYLEYDYKILKKILILKTLAT